VLVAAQPSVPVRVEGVEGRRTAAPFLACDDTVVVAVEAAEVLVP
jgi:hypothetical protein